MEEQDLTHGCPQCRCLRSLRVAAFRHHPEGSEDTKGKKGTPGSANHTYISDWVFSALTSAGREQLNTQSASGTLLTTSGLMSQSPTEQLIKFGEASACGDLSRTSYRKRRRKAGRRGGDRQGARGDEGLRLHPRLQPRSPTARSPQGPGGRSSRQPRLGPRLSLRPAPGCKTTAGQVARGARPLRALPRT